MRHVLLSVVLCSLSAAGTAAWAQSDSTLGTAGVTAPLPALSWGRMQGRVAFATMATPLRTDFQGSEAAFKVSSLSLMGDYYLRPSLNQLTLGGLRATGGLMFGQRSALWGMPSVGYGPLSMDRRTGLNTDPYNTAYADLSATPYIGIGYSGNGTAFGKSANWGFSADLGLMSLGGNTGRFGRGVVGAQSLDDMVRDLRLAPVLQLGFSYSF